MKLTLSRPLHIGVGKKTVAHKPIIHELVATIQEAFPPGEQIPDPGTAPGTGSGGRFPVPDWINKRDRIVLPPDGTVVLEQDGEALPGDQKRSAPPGNIDTLAYYLPFHFYRDRWGIYLRASGILAVASTVAQPSLNVGRDLLGLACAILLEHERFHFFSEIACSRAEILANAELYRKYFLDPHGTEVEEALCNAHAYKAVLRKESDAIRNQITEWMESQGPGYRDFARCLAPPAFSGSCRSATRAMRDAVSSQLTGSLGGGASILSASTIVSKTLSFLDKDVPTEFLYAGLSRTTCPVYVVPDIDGIGVLKPFPKYAGVRVKVHTNEHPPPHIHVEIPPGKEIARLEWDSLVPLSGDEPLSHKDQRSLDQYLEKHGEKISAKIKEVFG